MVLFEGRFVIDKAVVVYILDGVDFSKYLGVFASSNFRWDIHIDDITSRAYQRLGKIKRVLNKTPLKVKKVAYLTFCRPIITFSCEVWDPYLVRHETQLENIKASCAIHSKPQRCGKCYSG